jgi:hypothetical protein
MRERHSLNSPWPFPTPGSVASDCCLPFCLYHNAVNPRVPVTSHQPRPPSHRNRQWHNCTRQQQQRLTVVISTRDSLLVFPFPPPPARRLCRSALHVVTLSQVARREAYRVCMHVCPRQPQLHDRTPSREWQASRSFGVPTFPLLCLWPPLFSTRSVPKRPADDRRRRQRMSVVSWSERQTP